MVALELLAAAGSAAAARLPASAQATARSQAHLGEGGGFAGLQLRGTARRRDVSGGRSEQSWTYADHGASWSQGSCGDHTNQSPIDPAKATQGAQGGPLFFHSEASEKPVEMLNDGRTLSAKLHKSLGSVSLGADYPMQLDASYYADHIVVHTPSEHTFQGVQVPLELQVYHTKDPSVGSGADLDGVAAVAVGFNATALSSGLLAALRTGGLPDLEGTSSMVNKEYPSRVDLGELFRPAGEHVGSISGGEVVFRQYEGSLTEPPCSCGVKWFVRDDPLPASEDEITNFVSAITAILPLSQDGARGNTRVLQEAGSREAVPRVAKDVHHLSHLRDAVSEHQDSAYELAYENALKEQKNFDEQMNNLPPTTPVVSGTISGNKDASAKQKQFQQCVALLHDALEQQGKAASRQTVECEGQQEAEKVFEASGGGITRVDAATRLAAQRCHCREAREVAEALNAQVTSLQKDCGTITAPPPPPEVTIQEAETDAPRRGPGNIVTHVGETFDTIADRNGFQDAAATTAGGEAAAEGEDAAAAAE